MKFPKMLIAMLVVSSTASACSLFAQDATFSPVNAELQSKLDTKNAKVGDNVVLRASAEVKTSDGTSIPHNAKFMGKVTGVKPHDGSNEDAQLVILIDHAEWKGKSAPVHAVIQSLSPVQDSGPSDASSGGGPSGGGGRIGGGGGGGGASAARQANTNPNNPQTTSATTTTAASIEIPATPGTGTSTTTQADGTVVKTVTARPTAITGVYVASDPAAPDSGTLYAKGKNLHLDYGTIFALGVAPPAAK